MIRPYRLIPAAERNRTRDHEDVLYGAAAAAYAQGWRHYEADPICAAARARGLTVWPGLRDRLMQEARA
jgi:hypothetical protein